MKFLADLHIHSKFSRATSRDMVLDILARWAKIKGIKLLATSDITHPEWLFLIREKLEPRGDGFFRLKNILPAENGCLRNIIFHPDDAAFILSTEISFIYSKKGRVRKIHVLLLAPDFESVDRVNTKLAAVGNLRSDGRPILGWDAKQFLKMVADTCPRCVVIPAHIWTPWFSLFGANSGFDAVEECFEEMTPFIFAVETGLSSDPPMNRRLSALDKYTLVSNSDAHSPDKVGREGNVFDTAFSYDGLVNALKSGDPEKFLYTVEFFPEEGKYHYDGHRKCGVVLSPKETIRLDYICPRCGKKLTKGVLHRVEELADREEEQTPPLTVPYKSLIPLNEIIAQSLGKSSSCKMVWDIYFRMIHELGNEHFILTEMPVEEITGAGFTRIGEGVERMRKGNVRITPGHDGCYGVLQLYGGEAEDQNNQGQLNLF